MTILTVTFNPAIDLESTTEHLQPGEKLRCTEPVRDPGGGGINVARAIVQLGGQAVALVAAGGAGGASLAAILAARGVPVEHIPAPGELRQNLSVQETSTGLQYRFIFPGPTWSPTDVADACRHLKDRVAPGDWVVLSGSLPPGLSPETLVALIADLHGAGARVVADTSGPALDLIARMSDGALSVLRMDQEESEALSRRALRTPSESADLAFDLVARGVAKIVIIARGADGSVLASAEGRWSAPAAQVPLVSRTGAGDSFVAGTVLALSRGLPLAEVLQHGCAAASAAVTTPATDLCEIETVQALLPESVAVPV